MDINTKATSIFLQNTPFGFKRSCKKIEQGISKTLLTTVFIEQSDFSNENMANIVSEISQRSDMEYGGFGKGEKFMSPIVLKSLLRYAVQFDLLELKDFLKKLDSGAKFLFAYLFQAKFDAGSLSSSDTNGATMPDGTISEKAKK